MTAFDHYTARLCEQTHRSRDSYDATLHFGMFGVLKNAIEMGLSNPSQANLLLASKGILTRDTINYLTGCKKLITTGVSGARMT
jgi:hypothetical protein